MRHGKAYLLGIVALGGVGCQLPPESVGATVYVGALGDDADASLAVAVQGDYVAIYACGTDPTHESYPRWVTTSTHIDDPHVTVVRDGWRFDGVWRDATASGALVGPDGVNMPWRGALATRGSFEGLYTALDSGCMSGVIVTGSDATPVVRGAWCDASGDVRQIIPLLPLSLDANGLTVQVTTEATPRRMNVAPVTLPVF